MSEKGLYFFNILVSRLVNSMKVPDKLTVERILCVKLDEIGDMASALHVFDLLKKRYPTAEIIVYTKKYNDSLISHNPNISEIYFEGDEGVWKNKYQLIVELRGTYKTLIKELLLWPSYRLDRGFIRLKNRGKQAHETETNYQIIEPVLKGIPNQKGVIYVTEEEKDWVHKYISEIIKGKYAVMHVGARRVLRQWPLKRFSECADYLWNEFQIKTVLIGTENEILQLQEVKANSKGSEIIISTEIHSLAILSELIKESEIFIGNESGPLQIADLVAKKIIGIFGPGVKGVFYPLSKNAQILHEVLHCNPCDQVHCKYPDAPCITRISAAQVKSAIDKLMKV